MDCLLDLSLFKTKLALLMNLANPRGLSSRPPEPPWPEELILIEGSVLEGEIWGNAVVKSGVKGYLIFKSQGYQVPPMTECRGLPALDGWICSKMNDWKRLGRVYCSAVSDET